MLDANMKKQLEGYLQNLKTPVELLAYLGEDDKSRELATLMDELAALSPLVSVAEGEDDSARRPSMGVRSSAKGTELRFAGIPLGHEFTSLVLALLHSGGHPIKLDEDVIQQVAALEGDFHFETFISLSCQNCPDVVQALNMMAAINPNIHHEMVDGALFQDDVDARNVMAVPSVFLNGESFSQGRISLTDILKKVDTNAEARSLKALEEKPVFDVLVVGGGPAGAASAIYAARKGISTGVLAERFGGQLMDTVGIENFISVKETEGPKLAANLEAHVQDYDVDVMSGFRASELKTLEDGSIEVSVEGGASVRSRSVILATGARWREMNVPGEQEYRGKGVAYCPHCDGPLFKGKSVAVIGGGNSGIEAAIDLAGITQHVTVLEFDSQLRADEVLQRKARSMGNIDIITDAQTTEVNGDGQRVSGLTYTDRNSGESKSIAVAGIFVQIGLVPNTEFLKGGEVALSPRGEIEIDARGETSLPGVFAAGDVTTVPYNQIVIAMGSGATASLSAFDYLIRQSVEEDQSQAA
ncbi:alkyl hydroperoxide reductase subunit F [Spongiibacter nanhainus]|uniref:Alkyl hydroperoxide reductase subunit F n=1 Tax=Spongiibacter nanhainus TaxID=2794344 RepID=A0A7T4UQG2_9GAMM|nr:alkyl hydroperoxide reductase subunit F [Spongiibacter nanhainus]QQD18143.1 alkyl hydroperoxide reductase subunit F [Spongiibacter nanhainus]